MHVRFYEFSKLFSLVNKSTNHTQYSDIVTGKIQKGKVSKFDIFHPRSLQSRRNFLALLKRYLLQYEREIKSNGFELLESLKVQAPLSRVVPLYPATLTSLYADIG